ncbi:hypothetical protein MXD62_26245 [Frankia sp. Mgl5]|nr:hypothetical protein [Frankia sp. Mgl5]
MPCLVPGRGGSLAQLCLGALQVLDAGALSGHPVTHSAGVVGVSAPEHLSHESAAWNLTVGAGFLPAAARRGVAEGLVPLLTAFVTILSLLFHQRCGTWGGIGSQGAQPRVSDRGLSGRPR